MPKKQYLSVRAAALALLIHGSAIHPLAHAVSWGPAVLASSSMLVLGGCAASTSDSSSSTDKFVVTPASTVPLALALAHKGAAFLWTVAAPLGIPFLVGVVANFALTPIWEWYFRGAQSFVAEAVKPPPAVGRYASLSVTSMATFLLNQGAFANGGQAAYDRYIGDINKVAKLPTGTDAETIAQLREVNHRYDPASAQAIDRIHQALSFLKVSQFNDLWERWANLSDAMTNALLNHTNQDSWAREYGQRAQQLLGGFSQDHGLSAQQATNLTQAFVQTPGVEFEGSRPTRAAAIEFDYYYRGRGGTFINVTLTPFDDAERVAEKFAKAATESDGDGDKGKCKRVPCTCKRVSCTYTLTPYEDIDTLPSFLPSVQILTYSWEFEVDAARDTFCGETPPFDVLTTKPPESMTLPVGAIVRQSLMSSASVENVDANLCKYPTRVWWNLDPARDNVGRKPFFDPSS